MRPLLARIGTVLVPGLVPVLVLVSVVVPPAAGAAVRRGQPGQVVVHTSTFDLTTTATPQLFTVSCLPDEQLVSGGFTAGSPDVHVAFSYPSDSLSAPTPDGAQPQAWTVGAVNDTKTVPSLTVSAVCLAGGDGRSSVVSHAETHGETTFSVQADCPDGTVRSGGGFRSDWDRRTGTAAITGSYPSNRDGWAVDATLLPGDPDIKAQAAVTVSAVCQSGGIDVADLAPAGFSLASAPPVCTGADANFAATCVTPRSGALPVGCASNQVLAGGGYQVTTGALPGPYSVSTDTATGSAWSVAVAGSSVDASPIAVNVIAVCLVAVTATTPAPVVNPPAAAAADAGTHGVPIAAVIGGAVGLLLILLLLAVLALRRAGRRRPPVGAAAGIEVVVRAQRSGYNIAGIREVR